MTFLRKIFYQLKLWAKDIFFYPQERLVLEDSLDYDRYWEEKRGSAVGVLSDWQKARADIILKTLRRESSVTVGDIGCGEGSILKYLMDRAPISRATGYDGSSFVLEKAKQIGMNAVLLDLNRTEELSKIEKADYQLLLEVIEHFPHSEKILAAAYKKANKGVFFSFPNSGFFTYRLRLLFGKFPKQWIRFPNEHLRFWTARDLKWWLDAQGYKNYKIFFYKGVPVLNKIWPSLFAAGFVVNLTKQ